MNLDQIIRINITSKDINISQNGFGTPLIVGQHNKFAERTKSYSSLEELRDDGFSIDDNIYKAAQLIKLQKSNISLFKVGRLNQYQPGKIAEELSEIYEEDTDFYGLLLANNNPQDILDTATWVEDKPLLFGADITEENASKASEKNDVGSILKEKQFKRTFLVYQSKSDAYVAAAAMGEILPYNPGSSIWAFKTLTGVTPLSLKTSQEMALEKKHINRYSSLNDIGIFYPGVVSCGEWIDKIQGADWLKIRIQERLFALQLKNKKIPYTEKGIDLVRCELLAQMDQAVLLGILKEDPKPEIILPKVKDIDQMARKNRILPDVRFNAFLAGAIQTFQIDGTISS
jgi:hypothetical protein